MFQQDQTIIKNQVLTWSRDLTHLPPLITVFGRMVLLFPVIVVLLVAVTFLLGGHCGLWQWWLAIALSATVIFPLCRTSKRFVQTLLLFSALLLIVFVAANLLTARGWTDNFSCHLPAIRLMTHGWNPVWMGTAESVQSAFGVAAKPHILFGLKGVWYFCAAAFFFTRSPFNLFLPLHIFLSLSVLLALWKTFKSYVLPLRIFALTALWWLILPHFHLTDAVVAIAAVGLLSGMWSSLRDEHPDALSMAIFSFWMLVSKPLAALHCLLFWLLFLLFTFISRKRPSLAGYRRWILPVVTLFAVALVCISPYITSWRFYSHPLYPMFSSQPNLHPTQSLTQDFFHRNADAAAMGHLGAFINANISSKCALAFYRWKYSKPRFLPAAERWGDGWGNLRPAGSSGSPTGWLFRFLYTALIIILFLDAKRSSALIAACVLLATFAVPTEMIGYWRYYPWIFCVLIFCLPPIADRFPAFPLLRRTTAVVLVLLVLAMISFEFLKTVKILDDRLAMDAFLRQSHPSALYVRHGWSTYLANLRLLQHEIPALDNIPIIENASTENGFWEGSFEVPPDSDIEQFSRCARWAEEPSFLRRWAKFPILLGQLTADSARFFLRPSPVSPSQTP